MTKNLNKEAFSSTDSPKIHNFIMDAVQLVEDDIEYASIRQNMNPLLTYVKFILTDDKPNANKVRIPKEEFSNLIQTGIYMPIKMADGEIKEGHAGSIPLGVITYLKEQEDKIVGIAALWTKERPKDVALIKERYAEGKPLNLSWEIGFASSSKDDDGVEVLQDCVLRATTLVGLPAYGGRTPIIEVEASDESKEENTLELEQVKAQLAEVETAKAALEARIVELETNQLTDEVKEELSQLREFKSAKEAEEARLQTLAEIKTLFTEAGVEKDETYFTENSEKLLKLKEADALDFFISQLVTPVADESEDNTEELNEENSTKKTVRVPQVPPTPVPGKPSISEVAEALKNRKG